MKVINKFHRNINFIAEILSVCMLSFSPRINIENIKIIKEINKRKNHDPRS